MTSQRNAFKKAGINQSMTIAELAKSITGLQNAVVNLVQKQTALMEKLDRFVNKVIANEERLKRVEDNLINHTESATWIKAAIRFWPILIVALLFSHQIHALLLNYRNG
jgi:hypothetical protein